MSNRDELQQQAGQEHKELHGILDNACISYGYGAVQKKWAGLDVYFLNGYLFCGVYKDKIFVNVGADKLKAALKDEKGVEEFGELEKPGLGHYLLLSGSIYSDTDKLKHWLDTSSRFILAQRPVLCKHFAPTFRQLLIARLRETASSIPVNVLVMSLIIATALQMLNKEPLFSGKHFYMIFVVIFIPLLIVKFIATTVVAYLQVKYLRTHDLFIIFSEDNIFVYNFGTHRTDRKKWDWITGVTVTPTAYRLTISNKPMDTVSLQKDELCRDESRRLQEWLKKHGKTPAVEAGI